MARCLREAGFETRRRLALSYFRIGLLKRIAPIPLLVFLDRLLQPTGQIAPYSPSVFTLNCAAGNTPPTAVDGPLFRCPTCGGSLHQEDATLVCERSDGRWAIRDGIYDFKELVPGS
jgi:hypothetical protein